MTQQDIFKKVAGRSGNGLCKFWRCWENDSRGNRVRKAATRAARKRLRRMDEREGYGWE